MNIGFPSSVETPLFWEDACSHLTNVDRVMKRLISLYEGACLETKGDPFLTFARSIVGQQISVKAAQKVWERFVVLCEEVTPKNVLNLTGEAMKSVGLSARKASYLHNLSHGFVDNLLSIDRWDIMSDDDIIKELLVIKGIGRWTAEMFLIFHLMRPNVLPLDDVGLINAISQNYFSGENVSRSDVREMAFAWEPYRSVATWYLWRSLDPLPVAY